MKNGKFLAVVCALLLSAMPVVGSAYTITADDSTVNVGGLDTLLASAKLSNSGDDTELDWVNQVLLNMGKISAGEEFTTMVKTNAMTGAWFKTEPTSSSDPAYLPYWAYDFGGESPAYYFVKTGNLKLDPTNFEHFLYENLDSMLWGVIDLSFNGMVVADIGKISHVGSMGTGETVPPPPAIPEPSTLLLIGTGVLGLGIFGRRKFQK